MNSVGVKVFILFFLIGIIGATFGQTLPDEIQNTVKNIAEKCGDVKQATRAQVCVKRAFDALVGKISKIDEQRRVIQNFVKCLRPFEELLAKCGNDDYNTIFELFHALSGSALDFLWVLAPEEQRQCSTNGYITANSIWMECISKYELLKEQLDKPNVTTILKNLCELASQYRTCNRRLYNALSGDVCPSRRFNAKIEMDLFLKYSKSN